MHIADGVISLSVALGTTACAVGVLAYSIKGVKEEEIPRISLLTGAFFVASLINIPIGPTSVHPLLGGFLGLVLGRRAPLGIFIGLILQAVLFQHGGITTLGANMLLMAIPALLIHWMFQRLKHLSIFLKGFLAGFSAILIGVGLLMALLVISNPRYGEGAFSVIRIVFFAYIPLAVIEGILTGFAFRHLHLIRPSMVEKKGG